MPVVADAGCSASYGSGFDPSTMLCAGDGVHDTCQGDSGGPLIVPDGSELRPRRDHVVGHRLRRSIVPGCLHAGRRCRDQRVDHGPLPARRRHRRARAVGAAPDIDGETVPPREPQGFSVLDWDLDDDGQFDDASGATATRAFPGRPRTYRVGVRAQEADLDTAVAHHLVTVNGRPAVVGGGPYNVREGRTILLRGRATDPEEGQSLTFTWDLDDNSSFESSGQARTFSARGRNGPSPHRPRPRLRQRRWLHHVQRGDDAGSSTSGRRRRPGPIAAPASAHGFASPESRPIRPPPPLHVELRRPQAGPRTPGRPPLRAAGALPGHAEGHREGDGGIARDTAIVRIRR